MDITRWIPVVFLGAPIAASAWGPLGHKVTCEVAYQELNPTARAAVIELVRADPDYTTFADACNWPDNVRADESYDWAKPYHFVNVPREAKQVSLRRDCQPRGCAVAGIYRYLGVLRDDSASADDRRAALEFLGHFVGDAHQPMHVSFREDAGGNRVGVEFFGSRTNLHAVWDTGMVTRADPNWRELGPQLHGSITDAEREAWARSGPVEWANESYRIAVDPDTRYVDAGTCCLVLGQEYLDRNLPRVHERLRRGGLRLGLLLNEVWPHP